MKKNKSLAEHFKRFQHVEFEDTEQDQQLEQVAFQFFLMNPLAHQEYMHYTMLYGRPLEDEDKKKRREAKKQKRKEKKKKKAEERRAANANTPK